MELIYENVLHLLRTALWEGPKNLSAAEKDFEIMKQQAVSGLTGKILSEIAMPDELRKDWEKNVLQLLSYYVNNRYAEQHLPISVPYVILKGSAAAQYYPYPEGRTMGDIDLMTRPEDFAVACESLVQNGWEDSTQKEEAVRGRHRTYRKNGITLEAHRFFSVFSDPEKAEMMDSLIRDHIPDVSENSHRLPDLINGLVLIEHIYQHLRGGLGLRQIIDWMMYSDKCLSDEKWPEFKQMAEKVGMLPLVLTVTRMCEKYLGLREHVWCAETDEKTCDLLMDYILSNGNFGRAADEKEKVAVYRLGMLRHPILMIRELQKRAKMNRDADEKGKTHLLAWTGEGLRLMKTGPNLAKYYAREREMQGIFRTLGLNLEDKSKIYYEDGKYIKRTPK